MLVVCPTPIGNLGDITERQRTELAGADIIACEDTRRAGKLLERLGIARHDGRPRLWRYDDHTADEQARALIDQMGQGQRVVLVSDAGTPTISDPGYRLVREAHKAGLDVTALPGPVAAIVALSGSGLPTDRFYFEGFLPTTQGKRQERLVELGGLDVTWIGYESPRRVVEVLRELEEVCGPDREICVARELTKRHEEYLIASVKEIRAELEERDSIKGEIVICVAPAPEEKAQKESWSKADRLIEVLHGQGLRSRTIKDVVAEIYDVPRSQIYDRIEQVSSEGSED